MEILRVPPYPILTTWDVPLANTAYVVYIEDLVDHSVQTFSVTSSAGKKVNHTIPQSQLEFDRKFLFRIKDSSDNIVVDNDLDIVRPYTDPSKLGSTASEVEEYKTLEMVARSIIDTVVVDGFYNEKQVVQRSSDGSDYFAIWENLNKVLKVYENNGLIYDVDTPLVNEFDFKVTADNSAIERVIAEKYNRSEQGAQQYPRAYGDLGHSSGSLAVGFPKGWDYTFVLDIGYRAVPQDVEYASRLLIEDLKCGKLDYYTRYVSSYNSDQFRIQFDKKLFEGTGNMIVDKILDKYSVTIRKPGLI
jgi:hypothetical protein